MKNKNTLTIEEIIDGIKSKFSDYYSNVYIDDKDTIVYFLFFLKENTIEIRSEFYDYEEYVNERTSKEISFKFMSSKLKESDLLTAIKID